MSQANTPLTIDFSLEEQDYLNYQLYTASKSERIIKRRKRNKITMPIFYGVAGVYFSIQGNMIGSLVFFVLGAGWFVYYVNWEKNRYARHYRNHVRDTYKNQLGKKVKITLTDDFILASDEGSESKVMNSEISSIIEIPTLILIKLKTGQSFILPKAKLENAGEIISRLKQIAISLNIPYKVENDWVWK